LTEKEKVVQINKGMVKADFAFWVGQYMDKFYDALEKQKIVGNKCPECGDVLVPPRKICGKCKKVIPLEKNWVDLPETGTLVNYTITPYRVSDKRERKVKSPDIVGMIQIDGSNTAIVYRILDIEPAEVKTGMKVKVQWNSKTTGDPADIKGFVKV
jgi:uncharacterized OB-fold protein